MGGGRGACLAAVLLAAATAPVRALAEEPDHSTTHQGLTGLFNLISADTLSGGQVSFGVVHRNLDRELTDLDLNDTAAAFGIGLSDRVELGFAYVANRQIDFDDPFSGGYYNHYPFPITTIENGGGDLSLGLKMAFFPLERGGAGFSLFGKVKIPTATDERGRGTGEVDVTFGTALSFAGGGIGGHLNAAYTLVGDIEEGSLALELADAFTWGVGMELGTRSPFRGIVELSGEEFVSDRTRFTVHDQRRRQERAVDLTLGFKAGGAGHGGVTLGAAYVGNLAMRRQRPSGADTNPHGFIAELSYTSSEVAAVTPSAVEPTALNHPPTCSLSLTPAQVFPAHSRKPRTAAVAVQASDPDGDPLSATFSASGGAVAGRGMAATWSPPERAEEGSFTVTAVVSDGRGGEATCSGTVTLQADAEHFEGRVQFEFDRYDLTPEARTILDRVTAHLRRFPRLKLQVEGHCCYIATEEYNLQLGQQRAEAIRAYLLGQGIEGTRLSTISYGETRPWQDNSREITRRLNRRGEFRFSFVE